MIQKIEIRNFRCHSKMDVELDPHVTSIVGPSYTGKSTIIRALRWVVLNKPSGISMIRWGASKAMVRVSLTNQKKVIRKRGPSINTYHLGSRCFKAFGNEVPNPIQNAFCLSDINFQGQHDSPFWFSETAGEVSRQLNAIVSLDMIDGVLKFVASEMRRTRASISIYEEKVQQNQEKLEEIQYVEQMDEDFQQVEQSHQNLSKIREEWSRIDEILQGVSFYGAERDRLSRAILVGDSVLTKGEILWDLTEESEKLQSLIDQAESLGRVLETPVPNLDCLKRSLEKWQSLSLLREKLKSLINEIAKRTETIHDFQNRMVDLQEEIQRVTKGRCPLCGQKMKS